MSDVLDLTARSTPTQQAAPLLIVRPSRFVQIPVFISGGGGRESSPGPTGNPEMASAWLLLERAQKAGQENVASILRRKLGNLLPTQEHRARYAEKMLLELGKVEAQNDNAANVDGNLANDIDLSQFGIPYMKDFSLYQNFKNVT
ncbi:unnamed protein product, partial [Amoebophrya sp. A25]|eukprot:GSA25T00013761001.1